MEQEQDILQVGSIIYGSSRDRYSVEAILGKGGFSIIYLVRDQRVKQNLYALKEVIHPGERELEHLTFECEILRHIEHPSLPRLHRVFEDTKNNRIYILMDYIEGPNLEQLRRQYFEKRIALSRMLTIMAPIVEAISFLHHQEPPIVHRDIKPSNIIVPTSDEKAVLVDFGIAKVYESEATTTAVRHCSPGYGAPEQYGIGTTPRTDIYGLGATIYTLLTGTVPVDALQRMLQIGEKDADPLVPMQEIVPSLPDAVTETIHRAMSIRRADRFATVEEFWQALCASAVGAQTPDPLPLSSLSQNQLDALPDADRPSPLPAHFARKPVPAKKRGGRLVLILALLVLLGGLGAGTIYWSASLRSAQQASLKSQATVHPTSVPPNSSPRPTSTVYPLLLSQYKGTIADLLAQSTSSMTLSGIKQQGDVIRGSFVGLGLTGTFVGTIDRAGVIRLQVTLYGGSGIIAFEGNVKLGGSIAGDFRVLNQNREFTGEYGLWNVAPT